MATEFERAKLAFEQGDKNASFIDPTLGLRKYADVLTPGTVEYRAFNPAGATTGTLEQAKTAFQAATGQELAGAGLETVQRHLTAGNTAEQALANLGNLQNFVKFGGNAAFPTSQPESPQAKVASRLTTPEFAAQFQSSFGRAPSQDDLLAYVNTGTFPTQPAPSPEKKPITPESLGSATSTALPGGLGTDVGASAQAAVAGAGNAAKTLDDYTKEYLGTPTEADKKNQTLYDQLTSLAEQMGEKGTEQLAEEKKAGIPELRSQVSEISSQIQAKQLEFEAFKQAQQGKPITMASITGSIAQEQSRIASDILLLQARGDILLGRLNSAQANVDRGIDLKYAALDNRYKIYELQLNALKPTLDKEERAKVAALEQMNRDRQRALDDTKAEEKSIQNIMLKAVEAGVTDPKVLNSIGSAKTVNDAIAAFGQSTPDTNVSSLMTKYPDAGIARTDTFAQAQAKLKGSRIYQQATRLSGGGGGAGGGTGVFGQYVVGQDQVVDSWAERIQTGQAKITDIPAAQAALRNKVTVALSAMGNTTEGKPTVTEMGKAALATANTLLTKLASGEGTSAVGKSGFLSTLGFGLIPGTKRANFVSDFNSLKSQLSLEGVRYLKGQGAVSDAERALLGQAVTKLNLAQSESEFKTTLEGIIGKLSGTPASTIPVPVVVTAPNGEQVQIID